MEEGSEITPSSRTRNTESCLKDVSCLVSHLESNVTAGCHPPFENSSTVLVLGSVRTGPASLHSKTILPTSVSERRGGVRGVGDWKNVWETLIGALVQLLVSMMQTRRYVSLKSREAGEKAELL